MRELIDFALQNGNLTKMFSLLKPLVKTPLSNNEIEILANYFRHKDVGLCGNAKLTHQPESNYCGNYQNYIDWFTRSLRQPLLAELCNRAQQNKITMPVECVIESVGYVGNPSSIIRLKKPADYVNQELIGEGIPPSHIFVNMKLLTSHYHFVHSPCDGIVKRIMPVPAERQIFGKASLTYVVINTPHGDVALMIVGEAVVQDFDLKIKVGQAIKTLDPIGNFCWGSQVVMLFPAKIPDVRVNKRTYYYVGDTVVTK